VIRGGRTPVEKRLADEMTQAFATHQFGSVLATREPGAVPRWIPFQRYYHADHPITRATSRFWREEWLFLPDASRRPPGAEPTTDAK
jgi:hypothetical protein